MENRPALGPEEDRAVVVVRDLGCQAAIVGPRGAHGLDAHFPLAAGDDPHELVGCVLAAQRHEVAHLQHPATVRKAGDEDVGVVLVALRAGGADVGREREDPGVPPQHRAEDGRGIEVRVGEELECAGVGDVGDGFEVSDDAVVGNGGEEVGPGRDEVHQPLSLNSG